MDSIDSFRAFSSKAAEYTFFSDAHETLSWIDHMLGHRTCLNKFKIKIISSIFSDHNGMKLLINYKKKTEKYKNTRRLNNRLLNNE